MRSSDLAFSITGEQAEGQEDSLEQQGQNGAWDLSVHPPHPISGTVHFPLPHEPMMEGPEPAYKRADGGL